MKALVVVDGHLFRTPDGRVWSERIYDYSFFARYLMTFESIRVAMRIKDVQNKINAEHKKSLGRHIPVKALIFII